MPHQVRNDTSIWWIQNDVLYKLKIQSFNQNICCIKDGSCLYAEIRNEEAQVQSEAYHMKLRKWVVRSNFLIQTWFFGSFFIEKKWTEEYPFEQQFLIQIKKVNQITTQVKSQYNKRDSQTSSEWHIHLVNTKRCAIKPNIHSHYWWLTITCL